MPTFPEVPSCPEEETAKTPGMVGAQAMSCAQLSLMVALPRACPPAMSHRKALPSLPEDSSILVSWGDQARLSTPCAKVGSMSIDCVTLLLHMPHIMPKFQTCARFSAVPKGKRNLGHVQQAMYHCQDNKQHHPVYGVSW